MKVNNFWEIVEYNKAHKHDNENKSNLNDLLFNVDAEISPHDSFDKEERDNSAIQNWDRKQIKDP